MKPLLDSFLDVPLGYLTVTQESSTSVIIAPFPAGPNAIAPKLSVESEKS
ncbi:hypothetical protein AM1_2274 [Acaryochloris marina MBIC11017]|uniref:Uncharacterized protein n=1 Tax=Acaryochloris marina (strain MBIC 11017) TaxID=329726 RepID=B0C126_ACAM1|nr:hypothetical protein AM1_2274 [Acaryochloris marina MBIC11017]